MSRRAAVLMAAGVVLAGAAAPSTAAPKPKPKPKPITMTYKVSLVPDPSLNAAEGCASVIPAAQDKRAISLPAKGTLRVVLDGGDVPGAGGGDWDMYTLDANGDQLSAGESDSVHEETVDKVKGKTSVSIWVCNLVGTPDGTVTWTFTYA